MPPSQPLPPPRLQPTSSLDVLLPAPSIASRLQGALAVIPGALGSIRPSRSAAKKLALTTLAASGAIVIGHAIWRGGGGHVVASLVVSGCGRRER